MTCAKAHFAPTVRVETAGYGVTAALVAKGFGIAIVPRLGSPPTSESITRIAIRLQDKPLERHIALAERAAERAAILLTLIRHLADAAQTLVADDHP
jgi:DNA-binding transcriptional LysR family regulator